MIKWWRKTQDMRVELKTIRGPVGPDGLPAEIVNEIFRSLEFDDRRAASLINRTWRYEFLRGTNMESATVCVECLSRQQNMLRYARHVRVLNSRTPKSGSLKLFNEEDLFHTIAKIALSSEQLRTLDLSVCQVGFYLTEPSGEADERRCARELAAALSSALPSLSRIQTLSIRWLPSRLWSLQPLVDACRGLREFKFEPETANGSTPAELTALVHLFGDMHVQLRSFRFRRCSLDATTVRALACLASSGVRLTGLQVPANSELDLSAVEQFCSQHVRVNALGVTARSRTDLELLSTLFSELTSTLHHVGLYVDIKARYGVETELGILQQQLDFAKLDKLELTITCRFVAMFQPPNVALRTLFPVFSLLADPQAQLPGELEEKPSCTYPLRSLSFTSASCDWSTSLWRTILQTLPQLRVLKLSSVANFSDDDAGLIAEYCCKLQYLRLSRLRIRTFSQLQSPSKLGRLVKLKLVELAQLDTTVLSSLNLYSLRQLVLDGSMNLNPCWSWLCQHPRLAYLTVCLMSCDRRTHGSLVSQLTQLRRLRSLTWRYAHLFKYTNYFNIFSELKTCPDLRQLTFKAHPSDDFNTCSDSSARSTLFNCLPNVRVTFLYDT